MFSYPMTYTHLATAVSVRFAAGIKCYCGSDIAIELTGRIKIKGASKITIPSNSHYIVQ